MQMSNIIEIWISVIENIKDNVNQLKSSEIVEQLCSLWKSKQISKYGKSAARSLKSGFQ